MFGATVDIIVMQIHFLYVNIDVILTITKVVKRERIELITYFILFREEETLLKFYITTGKRLIHGRNISDVFLVKLLKRYLKIYLHSNFIIIWSTFIDIDIYKYIFEADLIIFKLG